jgi:hypothetical protein
MLDIFCPGADGIQEAGGSILFISTKSLENYWFSRLFPVFLLTI